MRTVDVARTLRVDPDDAWGLLVDTRRWPEWGPSVTAVECTDRRIRAGTTGRIRTPIGVWVPFEVTECADRRWAWRVVGVPATGHRVDALGESACRVVFEVPVLAAPYVPVCRRALDRIERLLVGR